MNSEKTLHFCLNSIKSQTYPNIELIVVDNFSTDNTVNIAKRYGAKVLITGNERASQLNYGIEKATGKYIFETGSDMVSEPNYIQEAVDKCEGGCDAVYSSVVSKEAKGYWEKVKALERKTYIGVNTVECSHFFRRRIFHYLGEFDKNLISVEEDFQHRLDKSKLRTGRIASVEIHLQESTSLQEIAKKSYYYGLYMRPYLKKHPVRGTLYLFPLRWAYVKNITLLLKNPHLTAGLIIYKIVQYFYGFLGLLDSYNRKDITREGIYGKSSAD